MLTVSTLFTGLAFLTAFLAVFGVNLFLSDLYERGRRRRLESMEEELVVRQRQEARVAVEQASLGQLAEEAFREQEEHVSIKEKLASLIEQAGLRFGIARLVLVSIALGALMAVGLWFLVNDAIYSVLLAVVVTPLPLVYVMFKRNQRVSTLRSQLPDSMELMSRVLRAGQTITQAMHAVADEFRGPVAYEFGYCYEQQNLGLSPEVSLRDLAKRTGLLEIKIFVLALLVHRQTGGNLTELLDKLAHIIRERFRIQGKIKALTAEGRLQALILLALPPFMYVILLVISRPYALELLNYPNLILGAIASMGLGALWIRKIVNFDF